MQRVKVDTGKNEVVLTFNTKFYMKEHIDRAVKDFNQICDSRQEGTSLVLIPKGKINLNKIGYEFYNYVLGLIKNE